MVQQPYLFMGFERKYQMKVMQLLIKEASMSDGPIVVNTH